MKLFGTDGIRGIAGKELTSGLACRLGASLYRVLAEKNSRPMVIVGRDTRESGLMLEEAVARGFSDMGGNVLIAGVVPTPAVAFLTVSEGADAGVMISASHNPAEYNGLKVFGGLGYKLPDAEENCIEELILGEDDFSPAADKGRIISDGSLREKYIRHVKSVCVPLSGRRIAFDTANGSASVTAREIFGPEYTYLYDEPDGKNINLGCGSTRMNSLCRFVTENGYDMGVAFDGDADRCLLCDENGRILDGDFIISALAAEMKKAGTLDGQRVVVTKLSNLGFHRMMSECGISADQTDVGDRYVLERMLRTGAVIGGEQSGHIILRKFATTGDGQITAASCLALLAAYPDKKTSEIFCRMKKLPQISLNVAVPNELKTAVMSSESVLERQKDTERALNGRGRLVLRPSGTEPIVRIMLEGDDIEEITGYAEKLRTVIGEAVNVARGRMD